MLARTLESPLGPLTVREEPRGITALEWGSVRETAQSEVLDRAVVQLSAYFAGDLEVFDLPLAPRGSAFQQAFYTALIAIPYGETRTYGDLAKTLGVSAQAIGQACGANPIPILIPCHRVLAADGLGGFSGAGGVEAKVALLKLEGAASLLI
jgi:methylated-DNA-[protein]-cysteine S-methyltransferase